jgi:hypothetical protein
MNTINEQTRANPSKTVPLITVARRSGGPIDIAYVPLVTAWHVDLCGTIPESRNPPGGRVLSGLL